MARLCQYLALGILQHQTEGEALHLDGAVGRLVAYGIVRLRRLHATGLRREVRGEGQHRVVGIRLFRHYRRCQQSDACRPWRQERDAHAQCGVVVVCRIGEVQHLHPDGPVAIQVECLSRRQSVAFPLQQSLTFILVERHQRVCQEIRVAEVAEVRRHVFRHTLQILYARIGLNLCLRSHGSHCTEQG